VKPRLRRWLRRPSPALALWVCAACASVPPRAGGGPESGSADTDPVQATGESDDLSGVPCPAGRRQTMLDAINLIRGDLGLYPLRPEPRLSSTAEHHALDLLTHGLQGHEGSDGSLPPERATRTGYPWILVGENVATGFGSASGVVSGWMASPPHRRNLLTPDFREVGIGWQGGNGGAGPVWVLVLGRRRAAPQGPPPCADGSGGPSVASSPAPGTTGS
jgi:uncharacterized protein YkwD